MEKRRTLSTIVILFIGIVIGFAIVLLIGAIGSYVHPVTSLTWPKKFGDIKIFSHKPLAVEGTIAQDIDEMLVMAKNNTPFLVIFKNKAGKITRLDLLNDKERPVFSIEPLGAPDKWGKAAYRGYNEAGELAGDDFEDINFDGHFDIRHIFDDTGKKVSRYIYIDQDWKKVDRCDFKKAIADTTTYVFDFNDGWR